jgi:hypothetical protein
MVAMANGVKLEPAAVPDTNAAADAKADSPISVLGDEVIYSYKPPFLDLLMDFQFGGCLYFIYSGSLTVSIK